MTRAGGRPSSWPTTTRRCCAYVCDALAAGDFAPLVTGDPEDLSGFVRTHRPGLVLLDLVLPGGDGLVLMKQVADLADLPVIFISAYGRDEIIARALDAVAADYIVKAFSATEMRARMRAALRRRAGGVDSHRVRVGDARSRLTPAPH